MGQVLPGSIREIELCWRSDLRPLDRAAAAELLRGAAGSVSVARLRRVLAEALPSAELKQLDDGAVLEQLASRIETGELVAFRRRGAHGFWIERGGDSSEQT